MKKYRLFAGKLLVPVLFVSIPVLMQFTSCVRSNMLTPRTTAKVESGTYSVILYRDLAVGYLTTVAFLDREDDAYTIKPLTASFTYTVRKGLQADEALKLAEQFVRSEPSYNGKEIKAIRSSSGNLLGYEVRPLYQPFVYGGDGDVLDISYFMRPENMVEVWVRLKNRVDQFHSGDGDGEGSGFR